ncbi:MAG TPA: PQQ-binding-like beta-propeller repeat protein [Ktedonobacterales bacterium]
MSMGLPPPVPAVRRALGQRAGALALLLLPLLAACSAPRGAGPDATIYAASKTGAVSALDAANGAVLWQNHCYCVLGMAVDSNHHTLLVTTFDSAVAALDTTTGKFDWRSTIGTDGMLDKLYLVGSMVIAASHPFPDTHAGRSVIVALDARSGALLWRVSLPGAITGALDIHTDRIYASVNPANASGSVGPGAIYALRATDGAQVWRAMAPTTLVAGPVSDQTQVYAPTNVGSVFALRASDGALQWNQNISASGPLSALFANATAIYVGDGDATMRALSKADGSVLWTRTIPNTTTVLGPLVYTPSDGGSLVLLSSDSTPIVDALSPSAGSVVWSQEAPGPGLPLFVLGDYIYLSVSDGIAILTLAQGRYAADYPVYNASSGYTSAEQVDLGDIAYIVAGPPRG